MTKPTMAELRNAAIDKRNAIHDAINAEYAKDAQAEDAGFDREFDALREAFTKMRQRPRPDHALLKEVRDQALATADAKLDAELKALYLAHSVDDNRFN
jgi:hypothetical protein